MVISIYENKVNLFTQKGAYNVLPYDGIAEYYGVIFEKKEANEYLTRLLNTIELKNDEVIIYRKHIITKRKVAWYGDAGFNYSYSNTEKKALDWTEELIVLRRTVENLSGIKFNSCLLNLYHDGEEGMSWHSDDEKSLGENTCIASLSFGAERKFYFKHKKTNQSLFVTLEHGSLLVMKGSTQTNWLHALPKSKRIHKPRINLTFRTFIQV